MATTATATKVHMSDGAGGVFRGIFTIVMDTTDANGELTLDLTSYFYDLYGISILGSTGTTGYVVEVEKPAKGTAITATNVKLGVYEAAADGGALDAVASTDVSTYVPGLTIEVIGRQAV